MYEQMEMVREFMRKHQHPERLKFAQPRSDYGRAMLRDAAEDFSEHAKAMLKKACGEGDVDYALMRAHLPTEEWGEGLEALAAGDELGFLDSLTDLLYVILGAGVTYDLPLMEAFAEVHRSNMTKESQASDQHRARLKDKGPNYSAPDLAGVLAKWKAERKRVDDCKNGMHQPNHAFTDCGHCGESLVGHKLDGDPR